MELISQDDVDERAKKLLKAHSEGDDRFTVKMSTKGIEFVKAGDIVTLDYTDAEWLKQTFGTRTESVTPFIIGFWVGALELLPDQSSY